jgi:ABC-type phosphate transport system auxiliary subunit
MTDTELLMYQLRNPPVMSMALNKDHLYKMMAESMSAAADHIEKLQLENTSLNTVIDMLHVAWDQTTAELSELKEKSKEN